MIKIIEYIAFVGIVIGIAGIPGNIEMNESPLNAIIILLVSVIVMIIAENIGNKRNGKNNFRIY